MNVTQAPPQQDRNTVTRSAHLTVLLLFALIVGCRRPVGAPLPPSQCRTQTPTIGPRDVLSVTVFNETNLTAQFRVSEDGFIDYPYVGRVRVEGMRDGEVSELIRRRLGARTPENPDGQDVLRDPAVRVEMQEVNSRRVSVFGEVQHPGVFPHQQCITVTQAISLAGGFTQLAEKNQVRVTRHDRSGRRRTFVLRVEDIAEGRVADFELEPGDVIFVPQTIA
ncbi:MAG: polysaccharide biosynthesis/export family protein [Polyangiales bacterium]